MSAAKEAAGDKWQEPSEMAKCPVPVKQELKGCPPDFKMAEEINALTFTVNDCETCYNFIDDAWKINNPDNPKSETPSAGYGIEHLIYAVKKMENADKMIPFSVICEFMRTLVIKTQSLKFIINPNTVHAKEEYIYESNGNRQIGNSFGLFSAHVMTPINSWTWLRKSGKTAPIWAATGDAYTVPYVYYKLKKGSKLGTTAETISNTAYASTSYRQKYPDTVNFTCFYGEGNNPKKQIFDNLNFSAEDVNAMLTDEKKCFGYDNTMVPASDFKEYFDFLCTCGLNARPEGVGCTFKDSDNPTTTYGESETADPDCTTTVSKTINVIPTSRVQIK